MGIKEEIETEGMDGTLDVSMDVGECLNQEDGR